MHNNIFMSNTNPSPFTIYDDISGISFEGNLHNEETDIPINQGFSEVPYSLSVNENGLLVPAQELIDQIGFGEVRLPVTVEETGADYYAKVDPSVEFGTGSTTSVVAGTNTLKEAIEASSPGDTLVLENGGEYLLTKFTRVNHSLTIRAEDGDTTQPPLGSQSPCGSSHHYFLVDCQAGHILL